MYTNTDDERVPTEMERRWKTNEEKQKAKQTARAKRLDFARPVSAIEPWKTRAGRETVSSRRPHSARMSGDNEKVAGMDQAPDRRHLPSEGEGDGAKIAKSDDDDDKDNLVTEEPDDVEDVIIADHEEVVKMEISPEYRSENTFTIEKQPEKEPMNHDSTPAQEEENLVKEAQDQDEKELGGVFTPLTPKKWESKEDVASDKEDSYTIASPETPKAPDQGEPCESSPIDEDDENCAEATMAADAKKKQQEQEEGKEEQLAEQLAEEHLITMEERSEEFVLTPIPQTLTRAFRCRVTRRNTGCFELSAERANGELTLLMMAKKKKAAAATTYTIVGGENNASEIGGMKANILGTNFTVFRRQDKIDKGRTHGISSELAVITYEPNILGLKGPRRIGVAIPGMTSDGSRVVLKNKEPNDSIVNRMKNNVSSHLIRMENKVPAWNEDSQSFVLNFGGRVTKASIKNFQIVHADDPDYIVFQFGRISEADFTLDFRYPLCPLQAFGCALSSMNRKLACE